LAWFYAFWQDHVVECGRQKLFELRDQWFDIVTTRVEWRDDRACRAVRTLFNAQIRWLHKFTIPAVALALMMPRSHRRQASELIQSVVNSLPAEVLCEHYRRLQGEAERVIATTMLQRSLVFWVCLLLSLPVLLPLLVLVALLREPPG